MKKFVILLICTVVPLSFRGNEPDTLTLEDCLRMVSINSPVVRQKDISDQLLNNRLKNLGTKWYPSVGLNAQALYNSETVEFADLLEGVPASIPSLPLDQYKVWAEINQQIYDGGMVKAMKEIEKAVYQADEFQTESELLALRLQVSQIYFSLLQTQNNSEIIGSSLKLLSTRKDIVSAAVRSGAILEENLLAMEAEEIVILQKLSELRFLKSQLFRTLKILTDSVIPENTLLSSPKIPDADQNGMRPELKWFAQQKTKLQINEKLIKAGDLPRLYAFSQLAWGRPGYNMVSRDFHTFYTLGAGLKWNFINYGDSKRQKRILELQRDLVDVKQNNFDDQLQIQLQSELTNIEKYDSLMKLDEKILSLRQAISVSGLSRLNNGVITSADYLDDMNAELLATLQLESHKILRKQAEYNYLMLQGKLTY
ncbi:TolC family protein [bacterium]|nr:MAG: TolC family protein [bacterium]